MYRLVRSVRAGRAPACSAPPDLRPTRYTTPRLQSVLVSSQSRLWAVRHFWLLGCCTRLPFIEGHVPISPCGWPGGLAAQVATKRPCGSRVAAFFSGLLPYDTQREHRPSDGCGDTEAGGRTAIACGEWLGRRRALAALSLLGHSSLAMKLLIEQPRHLLQVCATDASCSH